MLYEAVSTIVQTELSREVISRYHDSTPWKL